jgi:hypothetical protein
MQTEITLLLCESCFNLILEEEAQFLEHQPCCNDCSDAHKGVSP